jgi:membrane-bound lytic murein transglycosylase B
MFGTGSRFQVRSVPKRYLGVLLGALAAVLPPLAAPCPAAALPAGGFLGTSFGTYLTERLVAEGFEKERVEALLADPRGEILKTTLTYAIVYRETKADYSHFLDPDRLGRARRFLREKEAVLREAERQFQVPAEITAAILMIESDFGNFRKLHRTFNVFATLVWADQPENFETVRRHVRKRVPEAGDEKIQRRAGKKARWGYEQLVVLLKIADREGADPFLLEGSWAGAFGLPQFIPTSYWDYAVDGNDDRRVDLFDVDDAIYSIGNYLKRFGWKSGLTEEKKKAVLRRYNNSGLYVDTVLAAAARLESG